MTNSLSAAMAESDKGTARASRVSHSRKGEGSNKLSVSPSVSGFSGAGVFPSSSIDGMVEPL